MLDRPREAYIPKPSRSIQPFRYKQANSYNTFAIMVSRYVRDSQSIMLSQFDTRWQKPEKSAMFRVWGKIPEENTIIFWRFQNSFTNTMIVSSIQAIVLMKHPRFVTDRQTDRHQAISLDINLFFYALTRFHSI